MPIDTHVRVAAWLHIGLGILAVLAIGFVALFLGFFGAAVGAATQGEAAGALGWIGGFGVAMLLFVLAFPVLEIVGGAMLLSGSTAGRVITILFSVLGLINVPVGTAIGIYSLWALLREVPQPLAAPVAVEPGMRGY
jgi:hypothetical protein